jgi:hypothetical protein
MTISASDLMTRMAEPPGRMQLEQAYNVALAAVTR